jgi:PHD/YefM family antitoxin component YafN of YafNO toxin-antitoxin module
MKRVDLTEFRERAAEMVEEVRTTGESFAIWDGKKPFAILRPPVKPAAAQSPAEGKPNDD